MEKVVIVGTGAAGLTAAIYSARANLSPLVIDGTQPGGQLTTTTDVENYPGFPEGIDGSTLMMQMRQQAERFGTRFEMASVTETDLSARPYKITFDNGKVLETQTLIIATGASAMYLGMESEQALQGKGVSACATCDGAFYRNVPVAVIGGGDTAAEEAIFLTHFASKVYLVHRRDELRASKIMAKRVVGHEKIEVCWDSVPDEFLGNDSDGVTGLRLKNVKSGELRELDVKGIFVAIGHRPNTAPFKGWLDMDDVGYLKTNGVKTNIEGVYAAGDVSDPHYRQAITAAGAGCAAALEAERFLSALEA
ncbi:thioredoxin-disulfide reductase [Verrucomicrobiota bacterium]